MTREDRPSRRPAERAQHRIGIRGRTRRHLKNLLAAGAAAAGAAGVGGCVMSVDPAPEPIVCPVDVADWRFESRFDASFNWRITNDATVVEAVLSIYREYMDPPLAYGSGVTLVGATAVDVQIDADNVSLSFEPEAGATEVELSMPFTCDGAGQSVVYLIDIHDFPVNGALLPFDVAVE